jgi:hypothetical protein
MMEFFTVNLGNLLTIFSFFVGGLLFITSLKSDTRITAVRLQAVESELAELRKVVVEIARQEERLNAMDQRMLAQGQRIDRYIEKAIS